MAIQIKEVRAPSTNLARFSSGPRLLLLSYNPSRLADHRFTSPFIATGDIPWHLLAQNLLPPLIQLLSDVLPVKQVSHLPLFLPAGHLFYATDNKKKKKNFSQKNKLDKKDILMVFVLLCFLCENWIINCRNYSSLLKNYIIYLFIVY